MSGHFNPESTNLKRLRELYDEGDREGALREIYHPRTRPRIPEQPRSIPRENRYSVIQPGREKPASISNQRELPFQESSRSELPPNIGDYNIFQFKQAIQNNPKPVKGYINNNISWNPTQAKAFDDFMIGEGKLGDCKGVNCYQSSFLNLMANKAKTRSRNASPHSVYNEERENIRGFSPTENNLETLFNQIYRYPEEESDNEQEQTNPSDSSSESSEGEISPQRFEELIQKLSQSAQAYSEEKTERIKSLQNLSDLKNIPKNTVAYSYPRGVGGHTILADKAGTPSDSIWRSLQEKSASNNNPNAKNLAKLEDIGKWKWVYTNRFNDQ